MTIWTISQREGHSRTSSDTVAPSRMCVCIQLTSLGAFAVCLGELLSVPRAGSPVDAVVVTLVIASRVVGFRRVLAVAVADWTTRKQIGLHDGAVDRLATIGYRPPLSPESGAPTVLLARGSRAGSSSHQCNRVRSLVLPSPALREPDAALARIGNYGLRLHGRPLAPMRGPWSLARNFGGDDVIYRSGPRPFGRARSRVAPTLRVHRRILRA
jgi:hypothetical protein